jgi:hypothetical protein
MLIFKCFVCGYESNSKKDLKSKEIGKTYICPECNKFHGCLVETETQKEFPEDYVLKIKSSKTIPRYYAKKESIPNNDKEVYVYIQVFEAINITKGIFEYIFVDVPGSYKRLDKFWSRVYEHEIEIIKPVGKFILNNIESRTIKFQRLDRQKNNVENFLNNNDDLVLDTENENIKNEKINEYENRINKLENKILKLYEIINEIDLYKISSLDIDYLLKSNLKFNNLYIINKTQSSRVKKKYNVTKIISYVDNMQLNKTWNKDEIYYLGIPDLKNINLWLKKAYESGAVCCGFVPFSPLSDWFQYYIVDRSKYRILKRQKEIPFPIVEFSFRYDQKNKKAKNIKSSSMLNKKDIELGQIAINFSELSKR